MSFDVFVQAFREGESSTADADAARTILLNIPHKHEPQFNFYDIQFADGSCVELYAGGLDGKEPFTGAMFALRGMSDAIGDFVFQFARAAGCVLLPAMEPAYVLLTNEDQVQHLPADMHDNFQVITISNGGELLAVLDGGYDTWRAYRDQIVADPTDGA